MEVTSKTVKLSNAYVTLHPHSSGTSILNVTTHKGDSQHVAVWVGEKDIEEVITLLREWEMHPNSGKASGWNQPPSGLRGDPGAPRTVNADGATDTLANKDVGAPQEEP